MANQITVVKKCVQYMCNVPLNILNKRGHVLGQEIYSETHDLERAPG